MSFTRIWISFYTILHKEVSRIFRIWTQTLLPPVITQSLYFLVFGTFIGSRIGDFDGIRYMQFIVPGIVLMSVVTASFSNVVSSFFGAKFQKSIEEVLVTPTPSWVIILGFVFGGVARGMIVGFLVYLISFAFTSVSIYSPFIMFMFIFLTAFTFALGGLINGITATKMDDMSIFTSFILTPLTYLGGVFYSIKSLPPFWQSVSSLNPIVYMVDGFRYGFFGKSETNPYLSLLILVIVNVIMWFTALWMFNKKGGLRS
jgi:ABC-2 type transport system permease protein